MTDHQHTANVLNRAADLIEERGWVRGNAGMLIDGPHCIEGAIQAVLDGGRTTFEFPPMDTDPPRGSEIYQYPDGQRCPAYAAVADYLTLRRLWGWNDAEGRTAAEVIEVLRAAAVIEQARADEHTATDTGYDTAAEMRSVAGDAAARTLAALR